MGGTSDPLGAGRDEGKSRGFTQLLATVRLKRWAPMIAVGAGMLLLGVLLGATLFGRSAPTAAAAPSGDCVGATKSADEARSNPATERQAATPPTEASVAAPTGAPAPTKRSRARPPRPSRSGAATGASASGEGGHF